MGCGAGPRAWRAAGAQAEQVRLPGVLHAINSFRETGCTVPSACTRHHLPSADGIGSWTTTPTPAAAPPLWFAALATVVAVPLAAFTAFAGVWSAVVPRHPGGHGGCTPAGVVTGLRAGAAGRAGLPAVPGPTTEVDGHAVVVGLLALGIGPVVAFGLMSFALNLFG
ncbi:hypothetical protein EIL87_16185 [Saccharopolyspora rhizosphaerae]|uniref:Uncharacterized protein n=1 Tax=Saccharopolyspora rhizosphaerae TaxID=2492662 RepID=A0A3R8P349_9PSEU|nr:hypothetical protein [Saccharopolyspora rhizosphaerae]RRO15568.1 hypothetical protein EIL87_16185 [Saccharopolyspora rhizosphaerae]